MNANEAKHQARVAEWRERVRECRSSGLSVKAWCAGQGIKTATYYRWEHEVLTRADSQTNHDKPEGRPVFAELPETVIHKEEAGGKGRVVAEMETVKGVVRIYEGADAEVVRALCEATLC